MKKFVSITAMVTVLLFCTATLTGCLSNIISNPTAQYGLNATLLGISLKALSSDFENMEASIELLQENKNVFTEEEWKKLQNISTLKDMVVKEVKRLVELEAGLVTVDSVVYIYNLAKSAYSEGYEVVSAHWDDYDAATKIMLTSYNNKAKGAEARVVELLTNPNNHDLNEALTLIVSILGTAVKVLGVAAI